MCRSYRSKREDATTKNAVEDEKKRKMIEEIKKLKKNIVDMMEQKMKKGLHAFTTIKRNIRKDKDDVIISSSQEVVDNIIDENETLVGFDE